MTLLLIFLSGCIGTPNQSDVEVIEARYISTEILTDEVDIGDVEIEVNLKKAPLYIRVLEIEDGGEEKHKISTRVTTKGKSILNMGFGDPARFLRVTDTSKDHKFKICFGYSSDIDKIEKTCTSEFILKKINN